MRTVGSRREITEQAIRDAAVDAISRYGFHAASLRMLAKTVGIQAGSLYNYIHSKEEFLTGLIRDTLESMLATLRLRLQDLEDPVLCLMEFAWLHLEVHTDNRKQKEILIGNLELRNLSTEYYKLVTDLRDAYSKELTAILAAGNRQGKMKVHDARLSAFAVLSMLTGVSYWFVEGGRLSRSAVMREHVQLALQMVSAKLPDKQPAVFFKKAESRMRALDQAEAPLTAPGRPLSTSAPNARTRRAATPG